MCSTAGRRHLQGEVPVEDIMTTFEVRDGAVVADSYVASGKYMVFTERGLVANSLRFFAVDSSTSWNISLRSDNCVR